MDNTQQFDFIKLHETDRAMLVGLKKEEISTPKLEIKGTVMEAIVTYARCWLPKSRVTLTSETVLEVPDWLLASKGLDLDENQFMVFQPEGF